MMIIGLLAIGFLVYYLLGGKDNQCFARSNRRGPEDILKERFVNGEIDEITYLQIRQAIK